MRQYIGKFQHDLEREFICPAWNQLNNPSFWSKKGNGKLN